MNNLDYGRIVDGKVVDAPSTLVIDGKLVVNPSHAQFVSQNWKRKVYASKPRDTRYDVFEDNGWKEVSDWLFHTWKRVPRCSIRHTYRKSWISQWLYANGEWGKFNTLLESAPDIKFMWDMSTEFDSDHPKWSPMLLAVKLGLGLSSAELRDMLYFGEHGESQDDSNDLIK